ncbi:hypothetical protein CYMTET_20113, partial [Cymbomonas tetramitiformis]
MAWTWAQEERSQAPSNRSCHNAKGIAKGVKAFLNKMTFRKRKDFEDNVIQPHPQLRRSGFADDASSRQSHPHFQSHQSHSQSLYGYEQHAAAQIQHDHEPSQLQETNFQQPCMQQWQAQQGHLQPFQAQQGIQHLNMQQPVQISVQMPAQMPLQMHMPHPQRA